jgi:hypothetical protein
LHVVAVEADARLRRALHSIEASARLTAARGPAPSLHVAL